MIRGDNENVIGWLNGAAVCSGAELCAVVGRAQLILGGLWQKGRATPTELCGNWAAHVYREQNQEADRLASKALEGQPHQWFRRDGSFREVGAWRLHFDGGWKKGVGAVGWTIWAAVRGGLLAGWRAMASGSCRALSGGIVPKVGR